MDQEPEQIYELIVELNYPITLAEVRNPTSECMLKMVLTFLHGLSIDGKSIQKATFQQEQCLSYPEAYEEIINFINLHEVMQKICKNLFIKEFYLTDITSPGSKKARRLIFTLINFAFYSSNKMEDMIEPLNEINTRLNRLNDLTTRKNRVMEHRKEVVLENSRTTALKEKYAKQRDEAKIRIERKNKGMAVVEERAQGAKQTWQKAQQVKGFIKQQVLAINEKITEMESTLVESPEQYEAKLANDNQEFAEREEERKGLLARLTSKENLKIQFEKVLEFVTQEYENFSKVREAHRQSKMLAETKEKLSQQYSAMQAAVKELHDELSKEDDNHQHDGAKVDEAQAKWQEHIAPLLKSHNKYLSLSKDVKNRLEDAQLRVQQTRIEKQNLTQLIGNLEEQIATFLKDCQDLYNSDVQKEIDTEKLWRSKHHG